MIHPAVRAALLDNDYRRHIDEALARLSELEGEAATVKWAASLTRPLYENPPERWNAWTGDLIIESWESRAARLLTFRMWKLEEQNAIAISAHANNGHVLSRSELPATPDPLPQDAPYSAGLAV